MPESVPTDFERFLELLPPASDEVSAMLLDLRRKLKGWRQVSQATGLPLRVLSSWSTGNRKPGRTSARHVWLIWCLICRPGTVSTVFDLSTCGRFTKRADPATAGERLGNQPRKSGDSPGTCSACGQSVPGD